MAHFGLILMGLKGEMSLQVIVVQGIIHYEKLINHRGGSYLKAIDVNELPQGIYFLRLESDKGLFSSKLLIDR